MVGPRGLAERRQHGLLLGEAGIPGHAGEEHDEVGRIPAGSYQSAFDSKVLGTSRPPDSVTSRIWTRSPLVSVTTFDSQ